MGGRRVDLGPFSQAGENSSSTPPSPELVREPWEPSSPPLAAEACRLCRETLALCRDLVQGRGMEEESPRGSHRRLVVTGAKHTWGRWGSPPHRLLWRPPPPSLCHTAWAVQTHAGIRNSVKIPQVPASLCFLVEINYMTFYTGILSPTEHK